MTNPSLFAHKEMSFFTPVMINIGANFLFWLCLLVMLFCSIFKDQVFHLTRK